MFACRFCRIPIDAEHGCAMCDPLRKNLVSVDEDGSEERPSLSLVSGETVGALRAHLKYVRAELKDAPGNVEAAKQLIAISNSVAKVLESARKLQADGLSAIQNMSFIERAELFVAWYAELAPAYRTRLREQLEKHELEAATPVKQLTAEVASE